MYYKDRIFEWINELIISEVWREGEEFSFGNLQGYAAIFGCSPDTVRGVLLGTKGFTILAENKIVIEPTNNKERDFVCRLVKSPLSTIKIIAALDAEEEELKMRLDDLNRRRAML